MQNAPRCAFIAYAWKYEDFFIYICRSLVLLTTERIHAMCNDNDDEKNMSAMI